MAAKNTKAGAVAPADTKVTLTPEEMQDLIGKVEDLITNRDAKGHLDAKRAWALAIAAAIPLIDVGSQMLSSYATAHPGIHYLLYAIQGLAFIRLALLRLNTQ